MGLVLMEVETAMINLDKSWEVQDSTKIQTFMDCPRAYWYEYVLGWRPEAPNLHLEFGSAWHIAQEHLILCHGRDGKYTAAAVHEAFVLFLNYYRKYFGEMQDEINSPKEPGNALKALVKYAQEYEHEQFTPIYTEIYGTVPIGDRKLLHFKMDSILKTDRGIISREHKTGSTLSRQWTDQWALKTQVGAYNHVLYCLFPHDEVHGVEINGVFFQKKEIKLQRVPARMSKESMQAWFWNVNHWFNMIQWEFERLADCSENDRVMMCFPRNSENCTKYFGCRYRDYCMAWANPLQKIDEVPTGMKIEFWNPSEEEQNAKNVFRLEEIPHDN